MFQIRQTVQSAITSPALDKSQRNSGRRSSSGKKRKHRELGGDDDFDNDYDYDNNNNNRNNLYNNNNNKRGRQRGSRNENNFNFEKRNKFYRSPSLKRRRIIGVEIDARSMKEMINHSDFFLCEYHSNFPPILRQRLSKINKSELAKCVEMKAFDNQWILCIINGLQMFYWSTNDQVQTQKGKRNRNRNLNRNRNRNKFQRNSV